MTICARAPVRLDLAGGWTDVPPFCEREGGAVVNLAISRYAYATASAARPDHPDGLTIVSADYGERASYADVSSPTYDGTLDLLKACTKLTVTSVAEMDTPPGRPLGHLFTHCDVPPGSGTGSSSSVAVAVAGAAAGWQGAVLAAHEAADLAWRAERVELNIGGGTQDQYAAAFGGANFMEFHGRNVVVSPLAVSLASRAAMEKRFVLCYTGVSRVSGDIIDVVMGAYRDGRRATVDALRTMRALAQQLKVALVTGTAPDVLGELLADNWRCQRALHPSVTNGNLDSLYDLAVRSGAVGGKALGAGGGGCLLFWAQSNREPELRQALTGAGARLLDIALDRHGLVVWPEG